MCYYQINEKNKGDKHETKYRKGQIVTQETWL